MAIYKGLVVPPGATYLAHTVSYVFYKERKIEGHPSRLSSWKVGDTEWEARHMYFSVLLQHCKECLLPNQFQIEAWLEENKDD